MRTISLRTNTIYARNETLPLCKLGLDDNGYRSAKWREPFFFGWVSVFLLLDPGHIIVGSARCYGYKDGMGIYQIIKLRRTTQFYPIAIQFPITVTTLLSQSQLLVYHFTNET
jgi:hypothetical protein